MIIFFIVVIVIAGLLCLVIDLGKDTHQSIKEKKEAKNYNENKDSLFEQRVRQLGIHLDDAIEVAHFDTLDKKDGGLYFYMWYENGAIGTIRSPRLYGSDTKLYCSPSRFNVVWIERADIEGLYKRGNCCRLVKKDGTSVLFDVVDYEKIKNLFEKNGIECNYS